MLSVNFQLPSEELGLEDLAKSFPELQTIGKQIAEQKTYEFDQHLLERTVHEFVVMSQEPSWQLGKEIFFWLLPVLLVAVAVGVFEVVRN